MTVGSSQQSAKLPGVLKTSRGFNSLTFRLFEGFHLRFAVIIGMLRIISSNARKTGYAFNHISQSNPFSIGKDYAFFVLNDKLHIFEELHSDYLTNVFKVPPIWADRFRFAFPRGRVSFVRATNNVYVEMSAEMESYKSEIKEKIPYSNYPNTEWVADNHYAVYDAKRILTLCSYLGANELSKMRKHPFVLDYMPEFFDVLDDHLTADVFELQS